MHQFCEECGYELTPGALYCENCGVQIEVSVEQAVAQKVSVNISKTGFLNGLQCKKLFWFYYHGRPNFPKVDLATQFRFDQGHQIGELAKKLFPDGIEVPVQNPRDKEGAVQSTLESMAHRKPLFEASALHQGAYARIDVLNPVEGGQWDIYEVKSSTSVKEVHRLDVAYQKYVAEAFGINIRNAYLIHVSNTYSLKGQLDPCKLLAVVDLTESVNGTSDWVEQTLDTLKLIHSEKEVPEVSIGRHCDTPYKCDLKGHCWSYLPEHNVFTLYRGTTLAWELFERGVFGIEKIDCLDRLTDRQKIQYQSVCSGRPHVDQIQLGKFLSNLTYPIHHLDFETFGLATPLFEGVKPYQQIPFQYSLHKVPAPQAEPEPYAYLAEGDCDPRREFMEKLVNDLGEQGSIVTFNAAFEKARLRECCEIMPEYATWYESVQERFIDLLEPFRAFDYYHPAQKGSASIKAVLPALTGQSYDELVIQDGISAGAEFYRVHYGEASELERARVRENLLRYCALDTLAMHLICKSLKSLI